MHNTITYRDGLWIIDRFDKYGGFVVEGGKVVRCAPVFEAKLLTYWIRYAFWACT